MNTALFPATLGYWLKNWMAPVIPDDSAREARSFFTRFVSGRGPLPAVRVGNQPYGVLLTSDFSRWKYPQGGNVGGNVVVLLPAAAAELAFLRQLHTLLASLEKVWSDRAAQLPFVGKSGSDASEVLMDILGLHANSVEFFQRIGYSDEYLRSLDQFKDKGRYDGEMEALRSSMPPSMKMYFHGLGFEIDVPDIRKMGAMHVLWQHYVSALDVPNLVENKPPSETRTLTIDYIDWLAKAAGFEQIKAGNAAANSSLLYLMLRNALLLQLHRGSYDWLEKRADFEPALKQSLAQTTIAGVRTATPTLSRYELMATQVQAAEPAHVAPTTSVADWIWAGPKPDEVEAAFAQDQRRALALLASASTARLERAFVEHLDCCNYRLDAWQTGLFAQRLASQRAGRPRGIHLGAFGWVENLKPTAKVFIDRQQLSPLLQPTDQNPVLEEDEAVRSADPQHSSGSQGGFVHAPSIGHASAAALLRNAYLSHATPEQAEPFAINLSSERVRRAQFILEGMRNGQPIEALLGYQFERGLHDRSSASAASGVALPLELNQFILPYRDAFPFAAVDLTQAGSAAPLETVPANSVVNGLRLSEAALSAANGYGLGALLTAAELPDAAQGAAILAERDALLDTIDAVKDLLMAENAYQLVRGNFDRVAAVSLAQKDADVPNELEVINTPRGTQFTFTNRVTLNFAALDPAEAGSNPWPAVHMTPRANAEPGMNQWLGGILGAPEEVVCTARRVTLAADGTEIPHDERRITLADLEIQPIDLVWLLNIAAQDTGGATELEARVAWHYQRLPGVATEGQLRIRFNPPVDAPAKSFARLFPLLRHLRALLTENRALDASDLAPGENARPGAAVAADANPKGFDVTELRGRVNAALAELGALADALDGAGAPVVQMVLAHDPKDASDDETVTGLLGAAFDKLDADKLTFTDAAVTVTIALVDAERVHRTLRAISLFGIDDAFAPEADLGAAGASAALLARAHRVARRLRRVTPAGVLDRAAALVSQASADLSLERQAKLLVEAGKIVFAETFNLLPIFTCRNELDLATAAAARAQLLAHAKARTPGASESLLVEEWLQGLARVRPKLHRWEIVRTLAETLSDVELALLPAQVPFRALDSWLALEFPEHDPLDPAKPFGILRDTLSIAAHGAVAFKVATPRSGILIDDWTEEIPTGEEITGISFRFNQPNAAPPQAMLLVVAPEETGSWSWEDLVGTLSDTLARAKRRAVEPSHLEKEGLLWNAVAPALVSEFSTLEDADVSLDQLRMLEYAPLNSFYAALAARS